jgi:5'-3' exonuclease
MSDLVLMEQQQALAELMNRAHPRFLDCSNLTLEEAERLGEVLTLLQRDVMFQLGDLARYAEARWPDTWHQAFPHWVSPGLLSRTAGVCRAYPKEADRQHDCTYSQYMQNTGKPDRQKLLAEMVGLTTDETRATQRGAGPNVPEGATTASHKTAPRWLLAVDVNYFLHRFWHSGAGVESAMSVAAWVGRTVARLKEKGLTDVACCFDDATNHRKKLTEGWEDGYKGNRGPKDPELIHQLNLVRDLLAKANFSCISVEGHESDDCIASYAKTFPGKVAILSQDKDLKQCLSGQRVVMLLDVTWAEDDTSGDMLPTYHWYTEKPHPHIKCKNLLEDTGLTPQQFADLQCLQGDATDCIKGAPGIGAKGALTLMQTFGSVDACVAAAKCEDERLMKMSRGKIMAKGLLELEPKLEVTRKLVTLVDNLEVPQATRI